MANSVLFLLSGINFQAHCISINLIDRQFALLGFSTFLFFVTLKIPFFSLKAYLHVCLNISSLNGDANA